MGAHKASAMSGPPMAPELPPFGPEPIEIRDSKWTVGLLVVPCFAIVALGLWGLFTGQALLGGGIWTQLAAIGIAGIVGVTLLQMGFDPKPVLLIDQHGVTCRRPDVGLIPWQAVIAISIARAVVVRLMVLVTVDESVLEPEAREIARSRTSLFSALSRNVAQLERRGNGHSTIAISVSRYITPINELEARIDDMVRRHAVRHRVP